MFQVVHRWYLSFISIKPIYKTLIEIEERDLPLMTLKRRSVLSPSLLREFMLEGYINSKCGGATVE